VAEGFAGEDLCVVSAAASGFGVSSDRHIADGCYPRCKECRKREREEKVIQTRKDV
jgi:hypothetical protein